MINISLVSVGMHLNAALQPDCLWGQAHLGLCSASRAKHRIPHDLLFKHGPHQPFDLLMQASFTSESTWTPAQYDDDAIAAIRVREQDGHVSGAVGLSSACIRHLPSICASF